MVSVASTRRRVQSETEIPVRTNPFPGPRPFTTDESEWFHGRNKPINELASLVRAQRFCMVYAPSGAGKSSLINAGLLPEFRSPGAELDVIGVAKVHPGSVRGPKGWPDVAKVPNVYVTAALNSLAPEKRSPHRTLGSFLASREQRLDKYGDPVARLLVIDQFEEILEPFGREDWLTCRSDFFDQLDQAFDDDESLHVLISIREDHLATIERLTCRMRTPPRARYRLDRLKRHDAEIAIEVPAAASGLPFDNGVAAKLLDQLAQRQLDDVAIPDEFIEPGQMQVVCNRLWARAEADSADSSTEEAKIRNKHLEDLGGVAGALRKYYEEAMAFVSKGAGERRLRDFFEFNLVGKTGTRQLVPIDPGPQTIGVPNDWLNTLDSEFGLVREEQRGGTHYWELSHDGFVQPIRASNIEWRSVRLKKRTRRLALIGATLVYAGIFVVGRLVLSDSSGDDDRESRILVDKRGPLTTDPERFAFTAPVESIIVVTGTIQADAAVDEGDAPIVHITPPAGDRELEQPASFDENDPRFGSFDLTFHADGGERYEAVLERGAPVGGRFQLTITAVPVAITATEAAAIHDETVEPDTFAVVAPPGAPLLIRIENGLIRDAVTTTGATASAPGEALVMDGGVTAVISPGAYGVFTVDAYAPLSVHTSRLDEEDSGRLVVDETELMFHAPPATMRSLDVSDDGTLLVGAVCASGDVDVILYDDAYAVVASAIGRRLGEFVVATLPPGTYHALFVRDSEDTVSCTVGSVRATESRLVGLGVHTLEFEPTPGFDAFFLAANGEAAAVVDGTNGVDASLRCGASGDATFPDDDGRLVAVVSQEEDCAVVLIHTDEKAVGLARLRVAPLNTSSQVQR